MKYIRVGLTDFPYDHVQNRTLEELETMYHYLPKNVIRELHKQVTPKVKTVAIPTKKKKK